MERGGGWVMLLQQLGECPGIGNCGEVKEMALAAAVGGAEASGGGGGAFELGGKPSPVVFAPRRACDIPDGSYTRMLSQVVDVPVGTPFSFGLGQVAPQPTGQAAGSQRAAQVEVDSGREVNIAQPSYGDDPAAA